MSLKRGYRVWVVNVANEVDVHVLRDTRRSTYAALLVIAACLYWILGFLMGLLF